MPSKRKRSGPGYNRDDPAAAKRSKPAAYHQVYRLPSRNISGPGIFVTCVQSKERKAALQFIDLLNEVADRLYPGVVPQPLPQPDGHAGSAQHDGINNEDGQEDDMDALRNGPSAAPIHTAADDQVASVTEEGTGTEAVVAQENKEQRTEAAQDDIAAQIAAELHDIKASERQRGGKGGAKSKSAAAAPVRFKSIETDTECFVFISVAPPFDPYRLVYTILADVERTGEPRTRFVQRLTPVAATTTANASELAALAQSVLPRFFSRSAGPGEGKTFKIDPRIRSHSKLKRNDVIQLIASSIPTAAAHPQHPDMEGSRIHSANLSSPDLWIVVEVVKNAAAISVLHDYERFKKMNLQSVAQAANDKKAAEHDATAQSHGRIGASLVPKSTPAETQTAPEHGGDAEKNVPSNSNEEVVEVATSEEAVEKTAGEDAAPAPASLTETAEQDKDDDQQQMANFRLF